MHANHSLFENVAYLIPKSLKGYLNKERRNTFYTWTKAMYYLILPNTNIAAPPPLKITQLRLCFQRRNGSFLDEKTTLYLTSSLISPSLPHILPLFFFCPFHLHYDFASVRVFWNSFKIQACCYPTVTKQS